MKEKNLIVRWFNTMLGRSNYIPRKGDIGVYTFVWTLDAGQIRGYANHYEIFVKVKAENVFDDLVEVEHLSTVISGYTKEESEKYLSVFPKIERFIKIKKVKWSPI